MNIHLIIFDCDGVLIDSELLSAEVLLQCFAELGADLDLQYFHENCLGRSFSEVAKRLELATGILLPPDFEKNFRTKLLLRFESDLKPVAGIEDVLKELSLPFCVATSSYRSRAESALISAGLFQTVQDRLYTGDLVQRSKPEPDLFLYAASQHNVLPENCLVIEDSVIGIEAARAAKMNVWRFIGGSHLQSPTFRPAALSDNILSFASMSEFSKLLSEAQSS